MGEVWLAQDVRLERDVAVKILPSGFAGNEQFRARFEREGKALSALNHQHICTLFDIGEEDGLHFLVMERIEGEPLSDLLRRGSMPLDQVLEIGAQIASALDAAHKLGIVHRDLKPDNVMLTRAGAKLLDFGLAKPVAASEPIQGLTSLPTQDHTLTREGSIVGTFQYMAPEQLEGLEADARTDIFALGALLYEMATGQRAFQGSNKTSLIASIVSSQPPPISNVQEMTPPALDHVVSKCLEKDPENRWHSAGDIASQLRWIATDGSQVGLAPGVEPPRRKQPLLPWAVTGLFAVAAIVLGLMSLGGGAEPPAVVRASLDPPPHTALIPFDQLGVALSPDGGRLAFAAFGAEGGQRIWVRDLSSGTAEPVPETDGGSYPFWSPDGTHLAFFADSNLKKIDLRGGSPRVLAEATSGRGGSWGPDDTILFAPSIRSSIHRVPASGGAAAPVTKFDPEKETTHRWPQFLPGGKHFVYLSRKKVEGQRHIGRLVLGAMDSDESRVILEDSTNAVYIDPGYLVFGRSGDLLARPFDAGSLEFTGEEIPVTAEKSSFWEAKNFVVFTASSNGTIVYLPESAFQSELRWFDRTGRPLGTIGEQDFYSDPRLSRDGTRVAFVRGKSQSGRRDVWIHDLEYGREMRLTFESGEYNSPRWSPDGSRVAFVCRPQSVQDLCAKSVGDASSMEVIHESGNWNGTGSFTPDGAGLLFSEQDPQTANDVWILDTETGESRVLLRTPFTEASAEVSPDGKWFLYTSDETGRLEVYARETKEASQQWQLSTEGGLEPRWRADGREAYFVTPDGTVMAVAIQTQPAFRAASPKALFQIPEAGDEREPLFADVTPDGERFLVNLPVESRASASFHAIFNWR